jgi:hypothetical protein
MEICHGGNSGKTSDPVGMGYHRPFQLKKLLTPKNYILTLLRIMV